MRLLEPAGPVTQRIAAIGDVAVLGRARARAQGEGYDAVLSALAAPLREADWAFANLEAPVADAAWVRPGRGAEFHHDAELLPALRRAGIRVVSLANNHLMDCGDRGLARTLEACAAADLLAVGAGPDLAAARRAVAFDAAGRRVCVLAYSTASENAAGEARGGFAPLDETIAGPDVRAARADCDVLVVSVHWGSMYVDYPPPRVFEWADRFEAWGVDLVLGHHPHVVQGARRGARTLTLFSLGDVVFDPASGDFEAKVAAESRRETGVFTALLGDAHGLEFAPRLLDGDGIPAVPDAATVARIADRFARLSEGLADGAARFATEGASQLLRYELQSLGEYVRRGRFDRVAALLGSMRPRHLPLLWNALRRAGRS